MQDTGRIQARRRTRKVFIDLFTATFIVAYIVYLTINNLFNYDIRIKDYRDFGVNGHYKDGDTLRQNVPQNSTSDPSQKSRQNIKRLAILSLFAANTVHKLPLMFEQWQTFSPCGGHSILNKSRKHQKEHGQQIRRGHSHYNADSRDKFNHHDHDIHHHHTNNHDDLVPLVQVNIILSYNQYLNDSSSQLAKHHFETIIHNFNAAKDSLNRNNTTNTTTESSITSSSWEQCIHDIKVIECGIDPNIDLYSPDQSRTNRMWVHGPNQQFITSMEKIMNEDDHLGQQEQSAPSMQSL
jgi:hypothetical protein